MKERDGPVGNKRASTRQVIDGAIFIFLLAGWVWLYRPVFNYLGLLLTREEFRTNQLLLAAVLGLIAWRFYRRPQKFRLKLSPHLFWPGLLLGMGCSLAYLLGERFLDIHTLSTLLFALATYGLAGLWIDPVFWQSNLPAALLLAGILPFGEHLETFAGYPLRVLTANLVRDGLQAAGIHSVSTDTILVFESGLSRVDIPCSGVKSLWTGGLFFVAATWIEGKKVGLPWLAAGILFAGGLVLANLARVAILVILGPLLKWQLAAEISHVPLGVLGFIGACAGGLFLIKRLSPASPEYPGAAAALPQRTAPAWLAPLLVCLIAGMGLLYAPKETAAAAPLIPGLQMPAEFHLQPDQLTPELQDWLSQSGVRSADRYTFNWQGQAGSLMLITSDTWRGQHRPERCFEVEGLTINENYTWLVEQGFAVRVLGLSAAIPAQKYSALYWLQSGDQSTDEFARRMWADLAGSRQTWVLVTVLFEERLETGSPVMADAALALREAIGRTLAGGLTP